MIFGSPPMRWVFYVYGFFVAFVKREKNRRNAKGVGVEFYPCQQAGLHAEKADNLAQIVE